MYADCYCLDAAILKTPWKFTTIQNTKYVGKSTTLKKGINTYDLNFNDSVYAMCFWGFDKKALHKLLSN